MKNEIIEDYLINGMSIEKLSLKYKMGKIKIKNILLENNIELKQRGGQQKYFEKPFKYDINNKILKCKICGKEFNDIENKSGSITQHIKNCYPNIIIPNKLFRSNYKKTNGKYWHFQFFNIEEHIEEKTIKCPECEWRTTDLINKSGVFTKHVVKYHDGVENFVKNNNDFEKYFNVYHKKETYDKEIKNDFVICKICGKKLKYVNFKHLVKHNITLEDYKIKYLGENYLSNSTIEKLKSSYNENLKYYPNDYKSSAEKEITEIIKSYGYEVLNRDKKKLNGTELDIFIPDINVAFEYNGLYYHTEKMGKDKNYHLNKQNLARENNIKLIHIFEDEWLLKKEICISKIIHIIGKNNNPKIYGRRTEIKNVNINECIDFLNKNHIQGYSNKCKYNVGAYYNNELVGIMSFYKEKNYWVLNRFATNINYHCVGIPSKIISHFIKQYANDIDIITFGDRNWITDSNNNIYTKLGFNLDSVLKPDYKYVNFKLSRNRRLHKFNFRKSILLKKYSDILNNNMTENEMTKIIGCDKIWDCGLFRYRLKIKKGH